MKVSGRSGAASELPQQVHRRPCSARARPTSERRRNDDAVFRSGVVGLGISPAAENALVQRSVPAQFQPVSTEQGASPSGGLGWTQLLPEIVPRN